MTIEERMEKVEITLARAKRCNRLLLFVVMLAIVLLALGAITPGIGTPTTSGTRSEGEDVVRAKEFILVDENGMLRANMGVGKDGPLLALYDEKGKPRIALSVDKEGPQLTMRDENDKPRIGMLLIDSGMGLTLRDEKGKDRAFLAVGKKEGPRLMLFDENGTLVWRVPP